MTDFVNAPPHYTRLNPQPIEVIEAWGMDFHLANVLKYIARAGYKDKDKELEDLKKARFYLDRRIGVVEKQLASTSFQEEVDRSITEQAAKGCGLKPTLPMLPGALFSEPAIVQKSDTMRDKIMPDGVVVHEQLDDGEWQVVGYTK